MTQTDGYTPSTTFDNTPCRCDSFLSEAGKVESHGDADNGKKGSNQGIEIPPEGCPELAIVDGPDISAVAECRCYDDDDAQCDESYPDGQGKPCPMCLCGGCDLPQKQAETRNDKTEPHQCQCRTHPGKERPFRSEIHPRIFFLLRLHESTFIRL